MELQIFWIVATLWFVAQLNARVILGAYIAAHDKDSKGRGLVLHRLHCYLKDLFGDWWSKPMLGCYKCMPSLWGGVPMFITLIYLLPFNLLWVTPLLAAFYAGIVCYISTTLFEKRALVEKQLEVATYESKLKAKELGENLQVCT